MGCAFATICKEREQPGQPGVLSQPASLPSSELAKADPSEDKNLWGRKTFTLQPIHKSQKTKTKAKAMAQPQSNILVVLSMI
jgi:hypothetical protein